MSAAPLIARRYLIPGGSSRYLSWMTVLSIVGISIGIAAMIVVLAVINGFETQLRDRFLAANAHILAFQVPTGISDPEEWSKRIKQDFGRDLRGVSPFVHSETMATKDGLMHNILVRGIHPAFRKEAQDLTPYVRPPGALNELNQSFEQGDSYQGLKPIIVGAGLLSILQSKVGDTINLIAPESSSVGEIREFKVVGVYDSGLKHYDNRIGVMALNDAQAFFKMKNRVHGLEIGLKSPKDSTRIAEKMTFKYNLTIKEWQSFNKELFDSMNMERAVIALIVALVGFVAGFNILTTLFITVTQKQRSISVLKALGASNVEILKIFLFQGFLFGTIGALIGVVLAFIISKILETFEIINLPDLYLLARLPVTYDWSVYASMALAGCLICVLAGLYPAWVGSRVNIVEGFRGQKI